MKKLFLILLIFFVFETSFSQEILKLREYLTKADIFIDKGDLNSALDILNIGKQKALNISGKNTDLYADFQEKIGMVYLYGKKYLEARNQQIKVLGIRIKLHGKNDIKVSDSYNNLGLLYLKTGEYFKSLKFYENALKIRKDILPNDDLKITGSLINTGRAYLKTENPDFALKCFSEALSIKEKKLNPYNQELAILYAEIGKSYNILEEYEKAYENYEEALQITIHNFGKNDKETAGLYANAATMLNLSGKYNKALEYNQKAIEIFKEKFGEESPAVAKVLINIGSVFLNMNNIKSAVENFNKSLEISKKQYETWNIKTAMQYTKIGLILHKKSKNNAAINYFNNALIIQQNVFKTENRPEIAKTYLNIGNAYKDDDEYYSAIENYDKSLVIRLKISGNKNPHTAKIYFLKASAYKIKRDYNAELKFLQKALISNVENFDSQDISQNPDLTNEFNLYYNQKLLLETLIEKSDAFRNLFLRTNNTDYLKKAVNIYEFSDLIIERIKETALLNADKNYIKEKISKVYEQATAQCMQLYKKTDERKYFDKAFFFAEKNKSGIMYFLAQASKYSGMSDSLLNVEINLLSDITYFRKKTAENPTGKNKNKLLKLYRKHKAFIEDTKRNCPKYYELKYKKITASLNIIRNLISDSTMLLSYFSPKSVNYIYVFSVGKTSSDIHFIKDIDFNNKIKNYRRHLFAQDQASVKAYTEEGYALYKELIPGKLKNDTLIKQLIIIPDGLIGMISFEPLLSEEYSGDFNNFKDFPFLIKKYAVSYVESGNIFQNNYSEIPDSLYTDDWVGIAPIFDKPGIKMISTVIRAKLKKTQQTFQSNSRTRLLTGDNISFLSESEKEVTEIYSKFENLEKSPEADFREEADEEFIKLIDPEEFKYIHIVSHAFINAREPDLSGILFAHNNTDENDGVLFMNEFYNLNLNSDLLVLSACETGFGKYDRNESIAGFSKALFYTGTKNIIMSLWEVSGESTVDLMLNFYGNILNANETHGIYNKSLRAAKLKLIEEREYAHPYYWSPFILIRN